MESVLFPHSSNNSPPQNSFVYQNWNVVIMQHVICYGTYSIEYLLSKCIFVEQGVSVVYKYCSVNIRQK